MFVHCCVAFLALVSLTAAADPDCDELTQPVEDRSQLLGKWILYAGTADCEDTMAVIKTLNSSWIKLSSLTANGDMHLRYSDKMGEKCFSGISNTTFDGNMTTATFHFNSTTQVYVGKHLKTCPDCILWTDSSNKGGSRVCRTIFLFSKTGKVDNAYQEVFKKQIECLEFPSEYFVMQDTVLCPDEAEAAAAAAAAADDDVEKDAE